MLGRLGPEQVERVLQQECVGRIGCHLDGRTYVVPVTYWYDGQSLLCHSREGEKLRMMRANPSVCFQVDRIRSMTEWECVIAQGTFQEIVPGEQAEALRTFSRWLQPHAPSSSAITHAHGAPVIMFRIRLDERTGRFEHP